MLVLAWRQSPLPLPSPAAQTYDPSHFAEMRWRTIGPFRGGRTSAVAGVPGQPNVFYMARSTAAFGRPPTSAAPGVPIFDDQPTGSIGAIAVAPSDPNIIYVGSGEGLAAARSVRRRRHLQIHRRRQDLDASRPARRPADSADRRRSARPNRLFVAVLGHPYGPNEERGVLSLDRRRPDLREGALQGREHRRRRRGDRSDESRRRLRRTVGGAPGPVGKRRVERHRRRHLQIDRRRHDLAAAHAAACPRGSRPGRHRDRAERSATALRHRCHAGATSASIAPMMPARPGRVATDDPRPARPHRRRRSRRCPRSIRRIPTSSTSPAPSPGNRPTAARPGPRFAARPAATTTSNIWINPNDPDIILICQRPGRDLTVNGGETWSSWYNQPTAQMYHVNADNAFPYRVCGGQQESGSACVCQPRQRRRDHLPRMASGRRRGIWLRRARSARPGHRLRRQAHALRPPHRAGAEHRAEAASRPPTSASLRTAPVVFSPVDPHVLYFAANTLWKTRDGGRQLEADQPRPDAQDLGGARQRRQVSRRSRPRSRRSAASSTRSRRRRSTSTASGPAPTTA